MDILILVISQMSCYILAKNPILWPKRNWLYIIYKRFNFRFSNNRFISLAVKNIYNSKFSVFVACYCKNQKRFPYDERRSRDSCWVKVKKNILWRQSRRTVGIYLIFPPVCFPPGGNELLQRRLSVWILNLNWNSINI